MFLWSAASAFPARSYSQVDCLQGFEASLRFNDLAPSSQRLLRRVLGGDSGIKTRRLALTGIEEAFELNPDVLHRRFSEHAPRLAVDAVRRALSKANLNPDTLDALVISTCTGYLCPGLTSYVGESLGMAADAVHLDLVGHGCGAAIPNLRTAHALIHSGHARTVMSVCVEVCSAAFYLDDDPGVLISACLFGDAAGAVLCASEPPKQSRSVEWITSHSSLQPDKRESLRFEQRNGMLRNILARETPTIAADSAFHDLHHVLADRGLEKEAITSWITHAGGRRVLEAIAHKLALNRDALSVSWDLLSQYGNTSSSFVMLGLEKHLELDAPSGHWWMNSFGAGFSSHGILLKAE